MAVMKALWEAHEEKRQRDVDFRERKNAEERKLDAVRLDALLGRLIKRTINNPFHRTDTFFDLLEIRSLANRIAH